MRDRGKAVEIAASNNGNNFTDFNFSASADMLCKKHPSSSSVGICPQCLKDRLVKLVCSECGEQRLSSCSCSDISSSRISFLIENEKGLDQGRPPQSKAPKGRREKAEEVIVLRRSSSSSVEIKKSSNGFWKIKRLFGKSKREKGCPDDQEIIDEDYDDDDHQTFDEMRVSRSRSLCSFRDEGSDQYRFSSAKISDVTGGLLFDAEEPRKSGFRGEKGNFPFPRSVFPVKESDFSAMDESAFIDIKLDLSSSLRLSNESDHDSSSTISLVNMKTSGNGMLFGSCRVTGNGNEFDKGMKRSGKGNRVWKWISRQSSGRRSASKKDEKY